MNEAETLSTQSHRTFGRTKATVLFLHPFSLVGAMHSLPSPCNATQDQRRCYFFKCRVIYGGLEAVLPLFSEGNSRLPVYPGGLQKLNKCNIGPQNPTTLFLDTMAIPFGILLIIAVAIITTSAAEANCTDPQYGWVRELLIMFTGIDPSRPITR